MFQAMHFDLRLPPVVQPCQGSSHASGLPCLRIPREGGQREGLYERDDARVLPKSATAAKLFRLWHFRSAVHSELL